MAKPRTGTLAMALELAEAGVMLLREHLRRVHPTATDDELEALVARRMVDLHENEFTDGPFMRRTTLAPD